MWTFLNLQQLYDGAWKVTWNKTKLKLTLETLGQGLKYVQF